MHEAVERTGRADEHAATVAHHLLEAGDSGSAARWLLRAGRHAVDSYAGEQALVLLEQAERHVPPDVVELRFEVFAEQERVLDLMGRRAAQRAALDAMTDAVGDHPSRRSRVLTAQARSLFHHFDYAAAVPVAQEAAELAVRAGRTDLELQALLLGGRSLAFRSDHAAARRYLGEVLVRAGQVGPGGTWPRPSGCSASSRPTCTRSRWPSRCSASRSSSSGRGPTWRGRRWRPRSSAPCCC
jgi:hypothetical protein